MLKNIFSKIKKNKKDKSHFKKTKGKRRKSNEELKAVQQSPRVKVEPAVMTEEDVTIVKENARAVLQNERQKLN